MRWLSAAGRYQQAPTKTVQRQTRKCIYAATEEQTGTGLSPNHLCATPRCCKTCHCTVKPLCVRVGKLRGEVVSKAWFGKFDASHKKRLPPSGIFRSVKLGSSPSMEKGAVRVFRNLLPPFIHLRAAFSGLACTKPGVIICCFSSADLAPSADLS